MPKTFRQIYENSEIAPCFSRGVDQLLDQLIAAIGLPIYTGLLNPKRRREKNVSQLASFGVLKRIRDREKAVLHSLPVSLKGRKRLCRVRAHHERSLEPTIFHGTKHVDCI
jgi:hypothetical protein